MIALDSVSETLLIPLWARAQEMVQTDPIIRDPLAASMISGMDYDFSKFQTARLSQVGVVVRTAILDREVAGFMAAHPDSVVINLGAGLDTRFKRLDNGRVIWYELDLPQVIDLRRHFFEETPRNPFLAGSVLDPSWTYEIDPKGRPLLIVAEGLLMYLDPGQVRTLFSILAGHFSGAEMLFEMLAPALLGRSRHHDAVKKMGTTVEFKWSLKNSKELEALNSNLSFIEEWNILDYHRDRWRWFGLLSTLPKVKKYLGQRIVHLHLT